MLAAYPGANTVVRKHRTYAFVILPLLRSAGVVVYSCPAFKVWEMVPVLDANGRSVVLPTSASNKYGYNIEFDSRGRFENLRIDFDAIAEHLFQLDTAARNKKSGIALVIFEAQYLDKLFATQRGPYLKEHIKFMKTRPWVRHDEHYHVDFAVKCRPLAS